MKSLWENLSSSAPLKYLLHCHSWSRFATMTKFVNAPAARASNRAPETLRVNAPSTPPRGPITRRQHSLASKREENERRSLLLNLNDDLLEKVLSFLPGKELAAMESVCTHFRYGGWLSTNTHAMPEMSAKRKLDALELGEMPPGFRKMKWSRKLAVVEERSSPLTPETIQIGIWVRVKGDSETVKKLCRGDGEDQDYAVGWEQGMDDTVGKPFVVGVVSRAYRKSPVVGLSVANGLVAIAGGRFPTYGWFFPLEALEHV